MGSLIFSALAISLFDIRKTGHRTDPREANSGQALSEFSFLKRRSQAAAGERPT
jgi:hypothetical protein